MEVTKQQNVKFSQFQFGQIEKAIEEYNFKNASEVIREGMKIFFKFLEIRNKFEDPNVSRKFVEETEKQVVIHLQKHLDKISEKDKETIEILKTMQADEDLHAGQANESGAEELESPTKKVMEVTAKVMTSTSAYI